MEKKESSKGCIKLKGLLRTMSMRLSDKQMQKEYGQFLHGSVKEKMPITIFVTSLVAIGQAIQYHSVKTGTMEPAHPTMIYSV